MMDDPLVFGGLAGIVGNVCKESCGKKHFEAVAKDVKFDWVNGYDDFKRKFNVIENI